LKVRLHPPRLLVIALACGAACSHAQDTWIHAEQGADRPDVPYLAFAGSRVTAFTGADGKSCPVVSEHRVTRGLIGWISYDNDPACSHDTQYEGNGTAVLELRWTGSVPTTGNYELDTFGYTVKTSGEVVVRGAWASESFAIARLVVEIRSPHCSLAWSTPLAAESSYGPESRVAPFYAYQEIPPLFLTDCREGDTLDVRTQLVANTNRGRIDVEAFGFKAYSDWDAQHLFGLVLKAEGEGPKYKLGPCTHWKGDYCAEPSLGRIASE